MQHEKIFFSALLSIDAVVIGASIWAAGSCQLIKPVTILWVMAFVILTVVFYREIFLFLGDHSRAGLARLFRLATLATLKVGAFGWVVLIGAQHVIESPLSTLLGFAPLLGAALVAAAYAYGES